jgi:hypothetical protein
MVRQTPFKLSLYEFSDFHLLVRSNISTLVRRSEMFGVYLFNSRMNSTSSSERGRSIATVTNARENGAANRLMLPCCVQKRCTVPACRRIVCPDNVPWKEASVQHGTLPLRRIQLDQHGIR